MITAKEIFLRYEKCLRRHELMGLRANTEMGSAIAVSDSTIADVHGAVGYLTPSPMSPDAKNISDEMITLTRELAGAGQAVTGNVDPTLASGTAIIAVRDQALIPLEELTAAYKAFVEEVARVGTTCGCAILRRFLV